MVDKHNKPSLTVDVVLLCWHKSQINVLLIKRQAEPFSGGWALPGGFVEENEPLVNAANRELAEETGLSVPSLAPLKAFDAPDRDPRGWTISMVFWGLIQSAKEPKAGTDAKEAKWFPINDLPKLGFDHNEIIHYTRNNIRTYAENASLLLEGVGEISITHLKSLLEIL